MSLRQKDGEVGYKRPPKAPNGKRDNAEIQSANISALPKE